MLKARAAYTTNKMMRRCIETDSEVMSAFKAIRDSGVTNMMDTYTVTALLNTSGLKRLVTRAEVDAMMTRFMMDPELCARAMKTI